MTSSCAICNGNQQKNPQCRLFPFPDPGTQPIQYQKYLTVCDLQEQSLSQQGTLYICSAHFAADCIDAEGNLVEGSVPTANLERIEIEAYADEDFQMLEEYEPLFNVKSTAEAAVSVVCSGIVRYTFAFIDNWPFTLLGIRGSFQRNTRDGNGNTSCSKGRTRRRSF